METDKQQASATAKEVWSILREVSKNQKETDRRMQETDRKMQETDRMMKETDRRMKETDLKMQETDRMLKETDQALKKAIREAVREGKKTDRRIKQLNDLFHSKWGALVESLVRGDLLRLLNERGIPAGHTAANLKRDHGEQRFEFDILAINGEEVVVVEVKTVLKVKDVDYFLEKMGRFTDFAPEYKRKRIYGAVAYIKSEQSSYVNAEKRGLFVIRATGNSAAIINQKEFQPKAF